MLSAPAGWVEMVEVNPPLLPDMTHRDLQGRWDHVLITDNPFKQVRVSPYAYAARITHDVDHVRPTVVCSTRDRNILAIESEVRGAIGNGVTSFLVVQGDMLPEVEHWSNSYEIVEYLRALQESMPEVAFEVGMSTRSRSWVFRRRVDVGAQFLTTGPVLDPAIGAGRRGAASRCGPTTRRSTSRSRRRSRRAGCAAWSRSARSRSATTSASGSAPHPRPRPRGPRAGGWRARRPTAPASPGSPASCSWASRFETVIGEAHEVWHAGRKS